MKLATREVRPEILDGLAPDDPRAIASRGDLRRLNALMNHPRVMATALGNRRTTRLLEIGAGDGSLIVRVMRRLPGSGEGTRVTLLDRQPVVTDDLEREAFEIVTADVFDYLRHEERTRFDAIVANLFLHHFEDGTLRELLGLIAERTNLFVACEPRRSKWGRASCHMLRVIGCNDVTRHDARASVEAGFRGRELSGLWPQSDEWSLQERAFAPFGHLFRVERRG